jgi:hypothetical protein
MKPIVVVKKEICRGRPVYRPVNDLAKMITSVNATTGFSLAMITRAKGHGLIVDVLEEEEEQKKIGK